MKLDAVAREGHFADHILPVWMALPDEMRGTFYIPFGVRANVPNLVQNASTLPVNDNPTLVASISDLIGSRLRGRRCAIMEHGCGQSFGGEARSATYKSYAGGSHRDASLFLHPGPHPASRDRAAYPRARVEVVGCPKLDSLPRKPERSPEPVVAVAFHWDCRISPETQSGWSYFMPRLRDLTRHYKVIGHGHPRIIKHLAFLYRDMGIEVVRTFEEVCRRADVYLNDASSTLFEFASTGRPVVVLNSPQYRRNVNHGLRFWEAATVGVQVTHKDCLSDAVAQALADPPEQQAAREAALDLVYDRRPGAAQRAAGVLTDWAQ